MFPMIGSLHLVSKQSRFSAGLVNPLNFPNAEVTMTDATFTVPQTEWIPLSRPQEGREYQTAYALYNGMHILGYITANPSGQGVLLFNRAGRVVASLSPKNTAGDSVWLPANRCLQVQDRNGDFVTAFRLPWIPGDESFGVQIEGSGLNSRIVAVTR